MRAAPAEREILQRLLAEWRERAARAGRNFEQGYYVRTDRGDTYSMCADELEELIRQLGEE